MQAVRTILQKNHTPLFPNYGHLLDQSYGDPTVEQLMLEDLKLLVKKGLDDIDSLYTERQERAELAHRLAAFHEDLSVQMEASQEVVNRDEQGEPQADLRVGAFAPADALSESSVNDGYSGTGGLVSSRETGDVVELSSDQLQTNSTLSAPDSLSDQLLLKKVEYEQLLKEIDRRLSKE